jgi:hypothetical protein
MTNSGSRRNSVALVVMALLLAVAIPATSFGMDRGRRHGRGRDFDDRKCSKFVNCHDGRDGRWDGRGRRRNLSRWSWRNNRWDDDRWRDVRWRANRWQNSRWRESSWRHNNWRNNSWRNNRARDNWRWVNRSGDNRWWNNRVRDGRWRDDRWQNTRWRDNRWRNHH